MAADVFTTQETKASATMIPGTINQINPYISYCIIWWKIYPVAECLAKHALILGTG